MRTQTQIADRLHYADYRVVGVRKYIYRTFSSCEHRDLRRKAPTDSDCCTRYYASQIQLTA